MSKGDKIAFTRTAQKAKKISVRPTIMIGGTRL